MKLIPITSELKKKLRLLATEKDMFLQDLTAQLLRRVLKHQELQGLLEHQEPLGPHVSRDGVWVSDALNKTLLLLAVEKDMTKQDLTTQLLQISLELVNSSPTQRLNSLELF